MREEPNTTWLCCSSVIPCRGSSLHLHWALQVSRFFHGLPLKYKDCLSSSESISNSLQFVKVVRDCIIASFSHTWHKESHLAGMSKPSNVVAFLSIGTSNFDPRLLAVMGGAVILAMPAFLGVCRAKSPKALSGCTIRTQQKTVTQKLLIGGIIFGIGWGVGGLCPGPAMVSVFSGSPQVLIFTSSMLLGLRYIP